MHKIVLFDLDGTLVDSLKLTFDGCNHALKSVGLGPFTPDQFMAYFGKPEDEILANIADDLLGIGATAARNDGIYAAYLDYWSAHANQAFIHEGVPEILEVLLNQGYRLGIVTGRGRPTALDLVLALCSSRTALKQAFEVVITAHDVKTHKPSPEGLFLALQRMRLDRETHGQAWQKIMFVGDSVMDLQAARNAGLISVAAGWDSYAKIEDLKKQNPFQFLTTPSELLSLI